MVKQVNSVNSYNNYSVSQTPSLDFGAANIPAQENDSFVSTTKSSSNSSQKTTFAWIEGITAAVAATGFALFAREKIKTNEFGKTINETLSEVGETAVKSIKEGIKKLSEIGTKDSLSGMYNRRCFDAGLKKAFNQSVSDKKEMHAAILDMDFFKSINEVLGHDVGDEFIKNLGKNIREVTEKHGVKGYRYGGEEFAILLPGHNAESSQKIIQEISDKIKSDKEIQKHNEEFLKIAKKQFDGFVKEQEAYTAFWDKARTNKGTPSELAKEALKLLGENPKVEGKINQEKLNKAVEELKQISEGKSNSKIMEIINKYKNDNDSAIVANVLNQKHNKRKEITARDEWMRHVIDNKGFTVSAGISKNIDGDNAQVFFKRADQALEKAKHKGRNAIIVA